MTIRPLPRGRQVKLSGGVVNVPTDTTQVQTVLPRAWGTEDTIGLKLQRRLRFKGHYIEKNVWPTKIMDALKYLCEKTTLWPSIGVRINSDWINTLTSLQTEDDTSADGSGQAVDKVPSSSSRLGSQGDVLESDKDWSDEDDNPPNSGQKATLLNDVHTPAQASNLSISVAPGEGSTPLGLIQINTLRNCLSLAYMQVRLARKVRYLTRCAADGNF
jgi:hypothetical protein